MKSKVLILFFSQTRVKKNPPDWNCHKEEWKTVASNSVRFFNFPLSGSFRFLSLILSVCKSIFFSFSLSLSLSFSFSRSATHQSNAGQNISFLHLSHVIRTWRPTTSKIITQIHVYSDNYEVSFETTYIFFLIEGPLKVRLFFALELNLILPIYILCFQSLPWH